jgi:hypothetical protein
LGVPLQEIAHEKLVAIEASQVNLLGNEIASSLERYC